MEVETEEKTPAEHWGEAVCQLAVHGYKNQFLNENGIRTIQFLHENTIYSIGIDAKPSNIIPFPKETAR